MFVDAHTLPDNEEIRAQLLIIGGGAAGITIARELAGSRLDVVLVESGGLEHDEATQDLNAGENSGRDYYELDASRLRWFGGTTNHWGGRCTGLLDPVDFDARPWVPFSGRPIGRSDLEPFSARAHAICQLASSDYRGDHWARAQGRPELGKHLTRFDARSSQFSPPTQFGHVYRDDLGRSGNVRVILNGTATEIHTSHDGNSASHVTLKTLSGRSFQISATYFVLACGAIENARLLLLSNRQEAAGLGNRHDVVGRYFMEHLSVWSGQVLTAGPGGLHSFFEKRSAGSFDVDGYVAVREQTQREEGLLNFGVRLEPFGTTFFPQTEGWRSFVEILGQARDGEVPADLLEHLGNVVSDLGSVIDGMSDRVFDTGDRDIRREHGTALLLPGFDLEQAPNPDSRVSLIDNRDALGQNRVALHWQLSDLDSWTYQRGQEMLGADLALAGLGRLKIDYPNWLTTWPDRTYGHHHHLGTTRMHEDPRRGVVDADCRVHGIANLYVAGGSVFATGGYAYPTLNIVAFSLRLADHLRTELR